ncbi:TonB-dependent receptor, partial [mine drainage metagenome]
AGFTGTPGTGFNSINPNMSGQLGYQFLQNYYQAEGYKAGDIAEVKYRLFKDDNLYLGMKGQYATYHYYIDPMLAPNIVGGTTDAIYSQTSIVGYLEDHYRPVDQVLLNVGFRVASVSQYFNDQVPQNQWSLYNSSGPGGSYGGGGGVGVSNGGSMIIP